MSTNEQVFKMLGFANRARRLAFGMHAAIQAINKGKAYCVILATDVSGNSASKIEQAAMPAKVPVFRISDKNELGRLFGRGELGIIAVVDSGFAKAIKEILD